MFLDLWVYSFSMLDKKIKGNKNLITFARSTKRSKYLQHSCIHFYIRLNFAYDRKNHYFFQSGTFSRKTPKKSIVLILNLSMLHQEK